MIHYPQTPYVTGSGLVRYYRDVAGEIDGAVVLYLRDRGLPEDVFDDVLSIPNVVAVKYALPDVFSFARLVRRYPDRVVWVCGLAEMWAPFFWLVGGRGFTSGLVNVAPDASLAMLAALRDGDLRPGDARMGQNRSLRGATGSRRQRQQRLRRQGGHGSSSDRRLHRAAASCSAVACGR